MKKIPLSQGKFALVDDEDYEMLIKNSWSISRGRNTDYVQRNYYNSGKDHITLMHRLIMVAKKGEMCDHKNRDGLDNRRKNLRICTNAENARNSVNKRKNSSSGYKGIFWFSRTNKWLVQICVDYKMIYLGYF